MELNMVWTNGHTQTVLCVDANKDGHVASGGEGGEICLWNPDGKIISKRTFPSRADVNSMCFSPGQPSLLYVSIGEIVELFDIRCPLESSMARFAYNKDDVNQLAIDPKDTYLAACDDDGVVKIIDVQNRKVYKTLKGHDNICSSVMFHPQAPRELASGGLDCLIHTWDISRGRPLASVNMQELISTGEDSDATPNPYTINPPFVHSVRFSGAGNLLACGLENGRVELLERKGKKNLVSRQTLEGHTLGVTQVCFMPDCPGQTQDLLLSAGNDCRLLVWDTNSDGDTKQSQVAPAKAGTSDDETGKVQPISPTSEAESADGTVQVRTEKLSEDSDDRGSNVIYSSCKRQPIFSVKHNEKINWVTPISSSGGVNMVLVADVSKNITVYHWQQ